MQKIITEQENLNDQFEPERDPNRLTRFDRSVLLWIQKHLRYPWATRLWRMVTMSCNFGIVWIIGGFILLANKGSRAIGIVAVVALAISSVLTNLLIKPLVNRTRPFDMFNEIFPLIKLPRDSSFPSGHTSASFAFAYICYIMMHNKIGIAIMIFAFMIAFSRMYVGVHYLSDVVVGSIVGIFSARLALYMSVAIPVLGNLITRCGGTVMPLNY